MEDRQVPYYVYEGEQARAERHIKRLWILCIVIFLALVGTNAGWIIYESQFEDVTMTVTQDTPSGNNSYIGRDGNITNGATNDYSQETETENGR